MSKSIENDILVYCDECIVDIKKRLKEKNEFKIKNFRDDKKVSHKETLEFIISTLYHANNCLEGPQSCREKITKLLVEHGQFKEDEINEIFDENSYKSTDYSMEFVKNHPKIDFIELAYAEWGTLEEKPPVIEETKYNFPFSSCDYKMFIGFCRMKVETLTCSDCGNEVTNTPDNVTIGYEQHLICPICLNKREDEFDTKGLLKPGNPTHHGNWETQKPEIIYTGTDYFAVLHPKCKKSTRDDKKGFMIVNGLWADDCGRIVLSLECVFCGARNALKPFRKEEGVPLLNESGAKWKCVESPILEIIDRDETDKVEFKSSLRWDYTQKKTNRELEYVVARSISGFMNSNGGVLLIGVGDLKEVLGLDKDYSTLGKGKKNRDGFELQLTEVINNYIGKKYRNFVKVAFEEAYQMEICYIEIRKSSEPAFLNKNSKRVFAVRSGNRTQSLDVKEATEYIKTHW